MSPATVVISALWGKYDTFESLRLRPDEIRNSIEAKIGNARKPNPFVMADGSSAAFTYIQLHLYDIWKIYIKKNQF